MTGPYAGFLNDAAIFPPGNAPLGAAVSAHHRHARSWYAALVGPLVVTDGGWPELAPHLSADHALDVTLIVAVERVEAAAAATLAQPHVRLVAVDIPPTTGAAETMRALARHVPDGVTVSVELPRDERRPELLDALAGTGYRAKIRTGGTTAAAFPGVTELADVVAGCRDRDLTFTCTAGMHHAVRHIDPHTGFAHHGHLNMLLAAAHARRGATAGELAELLDERSPATVAAAVSALGPEDLRAARALFASFGTCSITEPVDDLVALGLLTPPPHDEENRR